MAAEQETAGRESERRKALDRDSLERERRAMFLNAQTLEDLPRRGWKYWTEEWCNLAREQIRRHEDEIRAVPPERLDYIGVDSEGVHFRVYGVIHGWTGGVSRDYRDLVRKSLCDEKELVFEKMLGRFYGQAEMERTVETPDFVVLRRRGQFALGLRVMLIWPLFVLLSLKEILRELLTKSRQVVPGDPSSFADGVYYHNIDPELRRGLDGSLPTRLQIEYEMEHWGRWKGLLDSYLLLAVVPRSAYIAEFARAWAECKRRELTEGGESADGVEVAVVVGDRHLTEVAYFLANPVDSTWLRRTGAKHARRLRRWSSYYHVLFGGYFFWLLVGAALGMVPWLVLLFFSAFYWRW